MTTYRPVIAVDKQHRPAAGTEKVDPSTLQLSGRSGNTLQVLDDGLFAGHSSAGTTFYVSSSGSDAPASGTKTAPYKTLDYCLAQIKANDPLADSQLVSTYLRIALKAGEVFDMETTVNTVGSVVLTFYGDPTYGDFDSPFVGGTTDPAVMSDLSRPTIRPKVISGMTIMHGFRLLLNGQIELRGVRVDLPDAGGTVSDGLANPVGFGDYSDFVTAVPNSAGQLALFGAIINKNLATGPYGIFGVHARCSDARLSQYASQFWHAGQKITAASSLPIKNQRQYFIKFYKDYHGNSQAGGFLNAGSMGSGLLTLNWSEVQAMTVVPGKTNLATYPPAVDQVEGVSNYIMNLTRDTQGRALNVICGLRI